MLHDANMTHDQNITTEILQAALSQIEEGIVVLDGESLVLFWNPAAVAITGHLSAEMLSRPLPTDFYQLDAQHHLSHEATQETPVQFKPITGLQGEAAPSERPSLVNLLHTQGHSLPAMLRRTPLRDALGKRFGTLLRFHPIEEIDTLPHGQTDADSHENRIEQSQADMEDRLDEAWQEWSTNACALRPALDQHRSGRDAAQDPRPRRL